MREWIRMKARYVVAILVGVAVIAIAALFAVRYRTSAEKPKEPVARAAADPEISLPATLSAVTSVPVGVPVEGKLEALQAEIGAEVYEGQLLAQIRSEALEAVRQAAETDLERAETRVRNLDSALSAARLEASRAAADAARVRNDYERAAKWYERQKMLLAAGATPRQVHEKAEKEFNILAEESKKLDAVAVAADERIGALQRDLDAFRKLLEGKTEEVEHAKERIGSGDIVSPVNGVVVGRRGQVGDNVHPSMTDLFNIAEDLSRLYAVAEASPDQLNRIKPGQPVTISLAEMGAEMLQGSVAKIEEGKVTVEFANPSPAIKPGMTAQIRIKLT